MATLVEHAMELFSSHRSCVYRRMPDGRNVAEFSRNLSHEYLEAVLASPTLGSLVLETGQPLAVTDAANDPRSGAMQPIMDAEFTRSTAAMMKKNPQLTAEQLQMGRSIGEKIAKVGAFIFVPITIFLVGLVLWVVGKFVDAKQTLGQAIMVAAYSYVPKVVASVVVGVQLLLMDPASLNSQ